MLVMMDCETDKAWSRLLKRKEDVPQAGVKFMDELVGLGKDPPSFLRMDRANEDEKMVELKESALRLRWSTLLMARTLQQNGKVERLMETTWNRVRAMLDGAGLREQKEGCFGERHGHQQWTGRM